MEKVLWSLLDLLQVTLVLTTWVVCNANDRPFLSCHLPPFQNESWYKSRSYVKFV